MKQIFAVSGTNSFLRRRSVRSLIKTYEGQGFRVSYIDGGESFAFQDAISSILKGSVFLVVGKPEKIDLGLFQGIPENIIVCLEYDGDTDNKKDKFIEFLGSLGRSHKSFPAPKAWKMSEFATKFLVSEFKGYGKTIFPEYAETVVERCGSDLGVLSFEVQKIVNLMGSSVDTVTIEHIRDAIAPLAETTVQPIIEALKDKNPSKLSRHLGYIKDTMKTDPTIFICRVLASQSYQWFAILDLKRNSVSDSEIPGKLKMNEWVYQNKILPGLTQKWSIKNVLDLIEILAVSERNVVSGKLNPWLFLVSSLLSLCKI
jgi:DNA polymerase III delta subunit